MVSKDLFGELDDLAISAVMSKGALVFRCSEPASAVYVIRTGRIALDWAGPNGVHPMDTVGPGGVIGMPEVLNGEYSVTARAGEESELGFIPAKRLMGALERDARLMPKVTKLLGLEVSRIRAMIVNNSERLRWNGSSRRYSRLI